MSFNLLYLSVYFEILLSGFLGAMIACLLALGGIRYLHLTSQSRNQWEREAMNIYGSRAVWVQYSTVQHTTGQSFRSTMLV